MNPMLWTLLILLAVWSSVWKGIALWRAGRNNQIGWFIIIFIFNTVGILPIIYLAFFQRKNHFKARKSKQTR